MALLDTFRPEFEAQALNTIKAPTPPTPGVFHNFASSAGNAFMRGLAETARAGSMAVAAAPVIVDALDPRAGRSRERLADRYFKWHDETFQSAVDHWTPRPEDVGAAGQIVGSLGAGLVQFLANPALMVGTAQLGTAEDLVRKGVDPGAALVAGDIAALSTVAGIGLPIFGRTLGQRIAAGTAGNFATNIPEAALKRAVVNAAGSPEAAAQFDPWDVQARIVDVLMGAAFGAKVHMDARTRDALMVMAAAKHMESAALPGRGTDAELTQGVDNLRTAVDQMLRGEPVQVAQLRPPPEVTAAIELDSRIQSLQAQREELIPAAGNIADRGDIAAARRELALLEQNRPADSEQAIKELAKSLQQSEGVSYKTALSKAKKLVEQQVSDFTAQQATDRLNVLDRELSRLQAERDRLPFSASLSPIAAAARSVFGGDVHPARVEVADFIASELPVQPRPIQAPDMAAAVPKPDIEGEPKPAGPRFADDLKLPTGEFDPATGEPKYASANDIVARATADADRVKATAQQLAETAAACLLGSV